MKAVVAETLESLESYQFKAVETPAPEKGQVLIRVAACGVGYVDALVALGRYQVKPPLPHTPGREVSGIVEAVGDGVTGISVDDRVMTMTANGFAEYALAPAAMVIKLPPGLEFVSISPPEQPGFHVMRRPNGIDFDTWFEGRLRTEIRLQSKPVHLP